MPTLHGPVICIYNIQRTMERGFFCEFHSHHGV